MKRLVAVLALLLWASPAWAVLTCPANVTAVSPSATSCWPLQETSGTAITDTIDSNSGTISGAFTLNQNGAIACNGTAGGCNITTPSNLTNPQPATFYWDFAGTSGGMFQLGTPSGIAGTPYYVGFLDNHGKLTVGVNNFGTQYVLQSPLAYADGNRHKAAFSVGALGEKLYVDGSLVASRNVTLANFVQGFWFFGGMNTAGWQLSPSDQNFNGSLYTFAWWNGTQLSDQTANTLTGGNPTPITNNYCSFSNQIASLNPATAQAFINAKLTFTTPALQVPGMCSNLPIAPSTQVCMTDATGTILPGCQVQQGAHVNLSVGSGPQIPLIIPCSTTCDLTAIMVSQIDPPEVVSAVAVAGPLFAGTTVTNPPPGTIGTATITAPPAFSQTQSSTATVNIGVNGNVQQVIMTGNTVTINLTNLLSGANFLVDTKQDGVGGRSPVFTVSSPFTLSWVGGGSQPGLPGSAPNSDTVWQFLALSSTQLVGAITSFSTSTGTFPLTSTANFNNFSGTNINTLNTVRLTAPAGVAATPTCSGGCSTTYTYEVSCLDDNSTQTLASAPVTAANQSPLTGAFFNTITWTNEAACHSGYNIYGRLGGSLGIVGTVGAGVTTFVDNSASAPGATPPTINTTGVYNGALGALTTTGDIPYENSSLTTARLPANTAQLATPAFGNSNVTNFGTTGATTYTYFLVCNDGVGGKTIPSASGATTTGNASLSSLNYNIITFPQNTGCASFDVLKTDTAHSVSLANTGGSYLDQGAAASPYTAPGANTTQTIKCLTSIDTGGAPQPPTYSACGNGVSATTQVTYLLQGSGAGNYTTTSGSYAPIDGTNLQKIIVIPVGFKLVVNATGEFQITTGNTGNIAIFDGSTNLQTEQNSNPTASSLTQPFALTSVITGDGNLHTIALEFDSQGGATLTSPNVTATSRFPVVTLQLVQSN